MTRLYAINTGDVRLSRWFFYQRPGWRGALLGFGPFQAAQDQVWCPCPAFLIQHEGRNILVDTGLSPEWLQTPGPYIARYFGPLGRLLPALLPTRPPPQPLTGQLAALGVQPEQVDTILMTHLDLDHIDGVRQFPQARVEVHPAELAAAEHPPDARLRYRYIPKQWEGVTLSAPPDHPLGATAAEPFTVGYDVTGDSAVIRVPLPGHSPGHSGVLVRLAGDRLILLAGDAAYTAWQAHTHHPAPTTWNPEGWTASHAQIAAFHAAHPRALIVFSHDWHQWHTPGRLRRAPAYFEEV
jgi:glyoxylase-like metal-dependent hydrolase (beta-lactamase superfamily II)